MNANTALALFLAAGLSLLSASFAVAQGVCLITQAEGSAFDTQLRARTQIEAKKAGIRFLDDIGIGASDHGQQVDAVDSCVTRGASGILIDPVDPIAIAASVRRAHDDGVLVVSLNTQLDDPFAADLTIAPDYPEAGGSTGGILQRYSRQQSGGGVVALVDGLSLRAPWAGRFMGFLDGLANALGAADRIQADRARELVTIGPSENTRSDSRSAMAAFAKDHEPINVVYTPTDDLAAGAVDALADNEPTGGIVLLERDACLHQDTGQVVALDQTSEKAGRLFVFADPVVMAELGVAAVSRWTRSGMRIAKDDGPAVLPVGLKINAALPKDLPQSRSWVVVELCWR